MRTGKWLGAASRILVVFAAGLPLLAAAPATNLKYFRNYFVTGDYAVGGTGMLATGTAGVAKKPIKVDGVPAKADILAAYLYWETMGDGKNGKFNGKAISGELLGEVSSPCAILPKINVYRADVLQFLKLSDKIGPTGLIGETLDGEGPYDVELPDSGDMTRAPLTEGASLVIVWRLAGEPYRGIVLFDGAFTLRPPNLKFNVNLAGFYQAATRDADRKARITHIVGGGQAGLRSNLFFNGAALETTSAFRGLAGKEWDNATFPITSAQLPADAGTATTASDATKLPPGKQDCVTWAAVVFSTTVQDTDKDGLLDTWEENGFRDMERSTSAPTGEFVDLKRMGADKTKRDLFIEIDWMKAAGHTHKPKAGVLTDFTKAFTDQGIVVHIDTGQDALFNGGEELPETASVAAKGGLESIKNADGPSGRKNFQNSRRFIFHYSLWGHQYSLKDKDGTASDENSCGFADLPGGDTLVMFGSWTDMVGNRQQQTGCFLHEFGHNLNLQHGGNDQRNHKPQYQSVMNYLYTLQGLTATDGKVTFDYSRKKLRDLDEAKLIELDGVGDALFRTRWFTKFAAGTDERGCGDNFRDRMTTKSGMEGIDWNGDGMIKGAADPVKDFDIGGNCGVDSYSGFEDWPAIDLQQVGGRLSYNINVSGKPKSLNPSDPASRDIGFDEYSKQAPNSVTGITAVRNGVGQAVLRWLPVQQQVVVEYRVYRFDGAASVPPSGASFVGRVLLPGPTPDDLDFPQGPPFTEFTDVVPVSAGVSTLTYFITAVSQYGVESDSSDLVVFVR